MPVQNIGLQRTRDLIGGFPSAHVDSLGFGTNQAADGLTFTRLGAQGGGTSFWKTGGAVLITRSEDAADPAQGDPWAEWEATFSTAEANAELGEIGVAAGVTNHAAQDDQRLYTRKKVGPITKTTDIELIGRVRVTF